MFESFALPLSVQPIIAPIHSITDIERAIGVLAEQPNGGVFFPPDLTIWRASRPGNRYCRATRMPAIYTDRIFMASGGLVSYDADRTDIFRRAASYVDRVLRGEKPGDLPYQQPTKYHLTINVKTAKALGLTVPQTLLAGADEVIE